MANPELNTFQGILDEVADRAEVGHKRQQYVRNPDAYIDLFEAPWSKQREIFHSVFTEKITMVKSANLVGKTQVAAQAALGWLDIYRYDAKVITTAKTFTSLQFTLWTRIRENYKYVRERFDGAPIDKMKFEPDPKGYPEWYLLGISPKIEGEEATAFQGYHAGHILIIVDEAIITPLPVWSAIEGILLSDGARLLAIFNPTTKSGEVYQMEQDKRGNLIHVSAYDLFESPEYKANPEKYRKLVSPEAVKQLEETYGRESPIFQARVLGEYPEVEEEAAVNYYALQESLDRYNQGFEIGELERLVFSWDVAGEGSDSNVLRRFMVGDEGIISERIWKKTGIDHKKSLTKVNEIIGDHVRDLENQEKKDNYFVFPQVSLVVDAVGEGSHVPSIMRDWQPRVKTIGFKGGGKAKKIKQRKEVDIHNKNSEAWYYTHLLVEEKVPEWLPIAMDMDYQTLHELSTRRYEWKTKAGEPHVYTIERKELWKERNRNRSPDDADAVIMGIWGIMRVSRFRIIAV